MKIISTTAAVYRNIFNQITNGKDLCKFGKDKTKYVKMTKWQISSTHFSMEDSPYWQYTAIKN